MAEPTTVDRFHLFAVHGVELEYMLVDARSLDVRPIADQLLRIGPDDPPGDIERGELTWSNELASHVIELKTTRPVKSLTDWDVCFAAELQEIQQRLQAHDARLLPTGMHPWMNPAVSLRLWRFGNQDVYQAFDRLFQCRGHGWANLQSVHLNLPFGDDAQFARLHAAIRLLLPLLPALAASSPFCEGRFAGRLDHRLHVYRTNARSIPSVTGEVVPATVHSAAEYHRLILEPMYRDVRQAGGDPVLLHEFLNARGAIARFSRGSVEIRLLDISECPTADLAICQAVTNVLRAICEERWTGMAHVQDVPTSVLAELLLDSIDRAEAATVADAGILRALGWPNSGRPTMSELWHHLLWDQQLMPQQPRYRQALANILQHGTLARRLVSVCGSDPPPAHMRLVYRELADCLTDNRQFLP